MKFHAVGHFGSRLSYATVASEVCRALKKRGLLAGVTNLDDKVIPEHEDLIKSPESGTHAILFVDPSKWLFDAMATKYGAQNVAVFASPNTDTMTHERAEVCAAAGMVLAPSQWCLDTVSRSFKRYGLTPAGSWLCRVPLGVSSEYSTVPSMRRASQRLRLLHLGTDYSWPGRKGSEELLKAWGMVQDRLSPVAELAINVPLAVYESAHYMVADLGLEGVRIEIAPARGSTDSQLVERYAQADAIVLPSRCEGFGMMILAACVSGTPLLTTYATGHADFLAELDGWLGVPTSERMESLEHETGLCPVVEPRHIAAGLLALASPGMLTHLTDAAARTSAQAKRWCWETSVEEWIETLEGWR